MTQAAAQDQREQQLVRGSVESVITKGPDKWQIVVRPEGSQYTKNLWTKEQPLVNDMAQRIGQAFDFLCSVSHWTNQQNQPVRSLWVDNVAGYGTLNDPAPVAPPAQYAQPAGQPVQQPGAQPAPSPYTPPPGLPAQALQQPPAAQQAPQAGYQSPPTNLAPQRLPDEVKDMRIMRQTASKIAAVILPHLPPEERTLDGMVQVCEYWVRYYTGGPPQARAQAQPQQPPPVHPEVMAQSSPPAHPTAPAPTDGYAAGDPGREQGDPGPYTGGFPQ